MNALCTSILGLISTLSLAATGFAQIPSPNDTTQPAEPATFKTLHTFAGTDGSNPNAVLIQATNGEFYGTTLYGGDLGFNSGTVFKIAASGLLTSLYTFCAQTECADGVTPATGLVQATNGDLYGTTESGGVDGFNGTVFKIAPSGLFASLHTFCSQTNCTDGALPEGALIQATNGDLYGTTSAEGPANSIGTLFKITPSGKLTTLHGFDHLSRPNGFNPEAALIQGTDGDLYGTTVAGGPQDSGTVFKIDDRALTTLYSFCSQSLHSHCTAGQFPQAGLIQATDGNFYGTTLGGGTTNSSAACQGSGCGTVFKITPGGSLTTLHKFCIQTNCPDGAAPVAGLIQATDGNFYGTTSQFGAHGGQSSGGTVFKITPGGTLTTLHSFCAEANCTDGSNPTAGLIQATNGDFYGTTRQGGQISCAGGGGDVGCGTVFRLSVGLGPFVQTQTNSGPVGSTVKILGTDLTGATSVTFNGTAATFTVVLASEISTTVPAGASTGVVEVITPAGTLTSNKTFTVTL